jgi:lipoprotein NlpI
MCLKDLSLSLGTVFLVLAPLSGGAGETGKDLLDAAARAFARGETKQALALADKAVARAPKDPRAHFVRGQIHDALAGYREAVNDYSRAVELDPKLAEAYDRRGSSHFKLGEFARSLADFDRFLELRPEHKPGHWRRGITCYYARKYDEGRKQFEGYEKVDTNDVENAVWRYLCMVPLVGVEKARVAMLKIGKDRRVPMMVVYELFRGRAKPADVLDAVKKGEPAADELNRRLFYAHLYLGLYHESLGDAKRALEHLTTAAEHRISSGGGPGYMWEVARVHRDLLRKRAK